MEGKDHVDNNNDGKRLSPPVALPNDDWWLRNDLPDLETYDPQFLWNQDTEDGTANEPASVVGPYGPHLTSISGGGWTYSAAGEAAPESDTPAYTGMTLGRDYEHTPLVNRTDHGDFPNNFSGMGLYSDQQTNANASNNFIDHHPDLPPSQVGFPDLPDHTSSEDPIFWDNYVQSSYDAPPPASYTTQSLGDRPTAHSTMQAPHPQMSPAAEVPRRPRRRRQASTGSQTPEASRIKRQCAGCDKSFYVSKDPDKLRCTRCYDKHVKHSAGHTTYNFDPNANVDNAWLTLYPQIAPLGLAGDDVDVAKTFDQDYCRRLIEAISQPYTSDQSGSKEDQQRVVQQTKLNRKPFDSTQYRDDLVNARIRFLFQIALSYHAGGPSMYDTGGDNSGYGEDKTMKFSDRMERIIQLLTTDKDIAMDVIEGRGVTALVHNPNKYERRKRDNKKSNDTKQDLQEKGKRLLNGSGGGSMPPSGNLGSMLEAAVGDSALPNINNSNNNVQPDFAAQFSGENFAAALQNQLAHSSGGMAEGGGLGDYIEEFESYAPGRMPGT
ncbi:hypothetical protein Q7P37_008418 [Cladosporium fusiforme]